jgi:hypothetical protein
MTVKSSISLTDDQHSFAKTLVDSGSLPMPITTSVARFQLKSTVDKARSSVSTIRSHSARVITSGGDMVMVLP